MSNPTGPDDSDREPTSAEAETEAPRGSDPEHEPATEVFAPAEPPGEDPDQAGERRFTAPSGFDAGSTTIIDRPTDPVTEQFPVGDAGAPTENFAVQKPVAPQVIPPRGEAPKPPTAKRNWGWVIAIVLVIGALVAVAILGTVLLTRGSDPGASQEDMVRATIQNYDAAIEKGDLATLRTITCGTTAEAYNNLDDKRWAETHRRVAEAGRYPVVASIDQIVVNGDHAEANVTTFMAYAPQTRSTRSFDLQFRDDEWKICQAPQ